MSPVPDVLDDLCEVWQRRGERVFNKQRESYLLRADEKDMVTSFGSLARSLHDLIRKGDDLSAILIMEAFILEEQEYVEDFEL